MQIHAHVVEKLDRNSYRYALRFAPSVRVFAFQCHALIIERATHYLPEISLLFIGRMERITRISAVCAKKALTVINRQYI